MKGEDGADHSCCSHMEYSMLQRLRRTAGCTHSPWSTPSASLSHSYSVSHLVWKLLRLPVVKLQRRLAGRSPTLTLSVRRLPKELQAGEAPACVYTRKRDLWMYSISINDKKTSVVMEFECKNADAVKIEWGQTRSGDPVLREAMRS